MDFSIQEFAELCGGIAYCFHERQRIRGYSLDSRQVKPCDLFLAIKGENVDGYDFIDEAIKRGAACVMTDRMASVPHIVVDDVRAGIARMAKTLRGKFSKPVVAITGSTGKTSTKELTAAALRPLGRVLKSEGNCNTELTSPFVWANACEDHEIAVCELGMRGLGQIQHLASFTKAEIGVITMIGTMHVEVVGSRDKIAEAKLELFKSLPKDGVGIFWNEDDYVRHLVQCSPKNQLTFGWKGDATCHLIGYRPLDWNRSLVRMRLDGHTLEAEIPISGRHQALNAGAAMLVAHALGLDLDQAAEGLAYARFPSNRMDIRDVNGVKVILDAYNAGPESMVASLRTFSELPTQGKKIALLASMKELGEFSEKSHEKVGEALIEYPVDEVYFLGSEMNFAYQAALRVGFSSVSMKQMNHLEEIKPVLSELIEGDTILVKGSRFFQLERIMHFLEPTAL